MPQEVPTSLKTLKATLKSEQTIEILLDLLSLMQKTKADKLKYTVTKFVEKKSTTKGVDKRFLLHIAKECTEGEDPDFIKYDILEKTSALLSNLKVVASSMHEDINHTIKGVDVNIEGEDIRRIASDIIKMHEPDFVLSKASFYLSVTSSPYAEPLLKILGKQEIERQETRLAELCDQNNIYTKGMTISEKRQAIEEFKETLSQSYEDRKTLFSLLSAGGGKATDDKTSGQKSIFPQHCC